MSRAPNARRHFQFVCFAAAGAVAFGHIFTAPAIAQEDLVQRELQKALEQLDTERARIAQEKIPLAERVSALEATLIEERRRMEETRRKADNRSLDLSKLRNDIKAREQEQQYLVSLFSEYLRNLESRLHIAELSRYETFLREARGVLEREDAPPLERLSAAARAIEQSVDRLESLIGGVRFAGQAAAEDGRLHPGTFALVGPVALFASADGALVGTVEQRLGSMEPSVAPFGDPALAGHALALIRAGEGLMPFDASLGNARKIEATKETLWEHIQKGGAVIWPILAMAALIFTFSLFKWVRLSVTRLPSPKALDALWHALRSGAEDAVQQQLDAMKGPAARMLQAGWARRAGTKDVVEEAMFAELLETRFRLNSGLPFIAVGAATAPLMGLLGTVTGIIATFKLITVFGSGDVKMLSAGISEALITTEFGLIVAIPSLLMHAFLSRKARAITEKLEQIAIAFLGALAERAPAEPAGGSASDATQTSAGEAPTAPADSVQSQEAPA